MIMVATMVDQGQEQGQNVARALTLRDAISAIRRRWKILVYTALTCGVLTASLAWLLPARYQSTGTILIEQQELPADLVRSTVTSYADQRVQVISQRVMTTKTLLGIIRRYDLYADRRDRESREAIIQRMRDDIALKMISADVIDPRSGMPRAATIAFSVSFASRDAGKAARVANELTTLYLNENLTSRAQLAQDASSFLQAEGDRLSRHMVELDGKLSAFKTKNVDQLPELTSLNMDLLNRTEQELREAQTRRTTLEQQRVYLESVLLQIKPSSSLLSDSGDRVLTPTDRLKMLRSQLASSRSLYSDDHPDIMRMRQEIAGLEQQTGDVSAANEVRRRLDTARGQLGLAREKYSPDHPDVQRLEREIGLLETELARSPSVTDPSVTQPGPPDNPAYIQIQSQLEATRNELAALTTQSAALRGRAAGYQRRIAVSPVIEKEYRELARDYEGAAQKYREIRSKQMEAQLAQNLETDRKSERFTLIEPPLPPEEPVSPNRPAILIVGLLLSLVFSGGAVALIETVERSVRGRQDLVDAFDAPPMAIIPRITTAVQTETSHKRMKLMAGAAAVLAVIGIVAIHFFYRPLDTLWFVALRRLG